jgi:peptidylprolyl isomerase
MRNGIGKRATLVTAARVAAILAALVALAALAGCSGSKTETTQQMGQKEEMGKADETGHPPHPGHEDHAAPAGEAAQTGMAGEQPGAMATGEAKPMTESGGEIVTTASGLRYQDLTVGTGASPDAGRIAVVHYTGWLTNGTKFDSSVDRGTPFEFPVGQGRVIKGWDEGVATMKVGGKRKLMIPPTLAYGPQGAGGVIPPNAELIFDVELLGVK